MSVPSTRSNFIWNYSNFFYGNFSLWSAVALKFFFIVHSSGSLGSELLSQFLRRFNMRQLLEKTTGKVMSCQRVFQINQQHCLPKRSCIVCLKRLCYDNCGWKLVTKFFFFGLGVHVPRLQDCSLGKVFYLEYKYFNRKACKQSNSKSCFYFGNIWLIKFL